MDNHEGPSHTLKTYLQCYVSRLSKYGTWPTTEINRAKKHMKESVLALHTFFRYGFILLSAEIPALFFLICPDFTKINKSNTKSSGKKDSRTLQSPRRLENASSGSRSMYTRRTMQITPSSWQTLSARHYKHHNITSPCRCQENVRSFQRHPISKYRAPCTCLSPLFTRPCGHACRNLTCRAPNQPQNASHPSWRPQ